MKKIMCMPEGNVLAHVTRPLEIAKHLRNMGYTVEFAGSGAYMHLPAEEGFKVMPLVTVDQEIILECIHRGSISFYNHESVREHVQAESAFFKAHKPDLVLGDMRMTLHTSCMLNNIPLAMIKNAFWSDYCAIEAKFPEDHFLTKIFGQRRMDRFNLKVREIALSYGVRAFKKFHKEIGLPIPRHFFDMIEADINLLADLPEFCPSDNLPSNYFYIGPIVWYPDNALPQRLVNLDPARPTIYFTMGSTGFDKYFKMAMDAFEHLEVQCIMTTANMIPPSRVPDNFYIFDYLPGGKIIAKSDVVICHGGNGTVYQTLIQGKPIVGIPTIVDQQDNMDRIVELGAGISLKEKGLRSSDLQKAVNEILHNKTYRMNAANLQQKLRNFNGPERGAQVIDAFLSQQNPVRLKSSANDRQPFLNSAHAG